MKYISCFSGIGGLEATTSPISFCEIDETCRKILSIRFPDADVHDNIKTFHPPSVEVVAGGWPCQDISVAGNRAGLSGERSGLFYELVRVAKEANAGTIVAENVPNLIRLNNGNDFKITLTTLEESGYPYVAWRTLNARQFGLPHERRRVFMIASKHRELALSIHREINNTAYRLNSEGEAAGFYWTAGTQSLCYSKGYSPTLKIGSGLSIPSPPAVHYGDVVRKLSPSEALSLQGFSPKHFKGVKDADIYSMAGNAVAVPVGKFVMDGIRKGLSPHKIKFNRQRDLFSTGSGLRGAIPPNGLFERSAINPVSFSKRVKLSKTLYDFLDIDSADRLSFKASSGLLRRLDRSGNKCPELLRECLEKLAMYSQNEKSG